MKELPAVQIAEGVESPEKPIYLRVGFFFNYESPRRISSFPEGVPCGIDEESSPDHIF